MIAFEDYCVGCPREIGCLGPSCPNKNVPVIYCDKCGCYADYRYEGGDYCEDCLNNVLQEEFSNLLISEKLEAIGGDWDYI